MTSPETQPSLGRPYRGSPPGQRREDRRERLLDAAVEVFGTSGYRTASIDRICAAAGLTKRYFYESFTGSEDMLTAVYRRATATMLESVSVPARTEGMSAEELLQNVLSSFFHTVAADRRSARIVLLEVLGVSVEVDALYRQTMSVFVDTVLVIAESVGTARGLAGPNRRTLAVGLVGAVLMMAQQWLLDPDSEPLDGVIESAHTILGAVAFGRVD